MNATQTLKSLKLKAFTITLEPILEGFDSLTVECKPVKYMDALKSVSGKIDMGAFSKFQGHGAGGQRSAVVGGHPGADECGGGGGNDDG